MNPLPAAIDASPPPLRDGVWRRLVRALVGLAMLDISLRPRAARLRVEDAPLYQRAMRGLLYRLLLVPVLVCAMPAITVWVGTHPEALVDGSAEPFSPGFHCEEVSFQSADGTALRGWIIPVVEARAVVEQGERALRGQHPAVVLVHGHAARPEQLLPLAGPLHKAGFVVMITCLRGSADTAKASTFGVREADDVQAAVETVAALRSVDPQRIAVLGVGTGANAAVLAAERRAPIAALVLENPVMDLREMVMQHIGLPQEWLRLLRPMTRWMFELAYRVNIDEAEIPRCRTAMSDRPVLVLNSSTGGGSVFRRHGLAQVRTFLSQHLKPSAAVATTEE